MKKAGYFAGVLKVGARRRRASHYSLIRDAAAGSLRQLDARVTASRPRCYRGRWMGSTF